MNFVNTINYQHHIYIYKCNISITTDVIINVYMLVSIDTQTSRDVETTRWRL